MQFQLNGVTRHYDDNPDLPLLTYLHDHEGITSPKDGCAPQAACGCCAVELNGKAVLSCVTPMKKVGGSASTTEGLGEYRQTVFANAFVGEGRRAVRLLHPRHCDAGQRAHRPQPPTHPRRDRQSPDPASVSLHRLQKNHRRHRMRR